VEPTKQRKRRLVLATGYVTVNHAAPRNDVPLRHLIEHFPRNVNHAGFGTGVDDGVPGG